MCNQTRRLERQISLGGTISVEEGGFLARGFVKSEVGQAVAAECDKVVKTALGTSGDLDHSRHVGRHVRTYATGFVHQLLVVSQRAVAVVLRDPASSVLQILAFILSALIVGAFYHGQLNDGANGMEDRVG
jgi:hypothetical protein